MRGFTQAALDCLTIFQDIGYIILLINRKGNAYIWYLNSKFICNVVLLLLNTFASGSVYWSHLFFGVCCLIYDFVQSEHDYGDRKITYLFSYPRRSGTPPAFLHKITNSRIQSLNLVHVLFFKVHWSRLQINERNDRSNLFNAIY